MSAFQVTERHIEYLVNAFRKYDTIPQEFRQRTPDEPGDAEKLAIALWNENARSVAYRYTENEGIIEEWPRYVPLMSTTPLQTLKAIHCYQYQACERPGWAGSAVERATNRLEAVVMRRIPGYDDAEWCIPASPREKPEGAGR